MSRLMSLLKQWATEGFLNIPSKFVGSVYYRSRINTVDDSQLGYEKPLSTNNVPPIPSLVSSLICLSSPSAIAGKIAQIVVYPFKGHSVWALTHIKEKVLEIVPTFANRNSPSSVIHPFFGFVVSAPFSHVSPADVCATSSISFAVAMNHSRFTESFDDFLPKASTGPGMTGSKARCGDIDERSAVAFAKPYNNRIPIRSSAMIGFTQNIKSSKPKTSKRYFSRHNDVDIIVVFSGGRTASTVSHGDYRAYFN